MVTFHHFANPLWLAERGGWENEETPALFARYVRKTAEALQEYCTLWLTINEPNVYVFEGYLAGLFPAGQERPEDQSCWCMPTWCAGMRWPTARSTRCSARHGWGMAHSIRPMHPAGPLKFLDNIPCRSFADQFFNEAFPRALVDGKLRLAYQDGPHPGGECARRISWGSTITRWTWCASTCCAVQDVFSERFYPPGAELSDTGFIANVPEGMFEVLKWAKGFNLPMIVTENGVEDADDHLRPRYLVEHIHQMWRAVNFNWPIKGYFHWTLVDNFEWERGWTQRFGLWGLDVETQQRIRRPSVDVYGAICKQNAVSYETVEKYTPQIVAKLFPG